ncbi:hypothetical protein TARUN_9290 [Trichoderma arundinaceum]|uniref:Uncharacterized protein n=1 Tax=Trichoderma arundinaceum TaxID=490622 RepID=A0A395NAP4_TRIAR|nr:hypothetical protein TARUN_9290 [Trichoderma arundinaceum]
MRFGVPRSDDYGKPHTDLWDFGFWGDNAEHVHLSEFKSLSAFSQFSQRYIRFHARAKSLNIRFVHQSFKISQGFTGGFRRFSLNRALLRGEDVSAAIQRRQLSRRLSCQLTLTYILSETYVDNEGPDAFALNGLKWLFENKMVCAIDKIPVWHPKFINEAMDEVMRGMSADRGHVIDDCSCGTTDESSVQKYGRLAPIWLIFLHVFATQVCSPSSGRNVLDRPLLEKYCRMLELWLQYGEATDAIILITPKAKDTGHETEDIFYIEIEQLLQVAEEPLNFDNLQCLLAARPKSWTSWIADWMLWAWNYSYNRFNTSDESVNPIRSRYRHISNVDLSGIDWTVYGVASDDDVLMGEFWYRIL